MFHLDAYTDAEFVAFIDSDAAFTSYVTPELLFHPKASQDGGGKWKPYMLGIWHPLFWPSVLMLGLRWVAEFMVSFPFVLRRDFFRVARGSLVAQVHSLRGSTTERSSVARDAGASPGPGDEESSLFTEYVIWLN